MDENLLMQRLDEQFSHVWMVRTFLKHSEEAAEEDELCEVHRTLYDVMHALGGPLADQNAAAYVRQARKKLSKLRSAMQLFCEIQPDVSTHMNFRMAAQSLTKSVGEIEELLGAVRGSPDHSCKHL